MKKLLIPIIVLLLFTQTMSFAQKESKEKVGYVNITYETKDNFVIKSKLFYPKEQATVYPTVIMLHSIGYTGDYWEPLAKRFVDSGAAVLLVDLRGHGQSMYDSNFKIHSWQYFGQKSYEKYPDDIEEILKYLATNYKNLSPEKYAIVGADIGANTAILAAERIPNKPAALVLMSPTREFKWLYVPIAMTNLGTTPIMTIVSAKDPYSVKEANALKKFAQNDYNLKIYPSGGMGMLMLKVNPSMSKDIVDWVIPKIK